MKWFHVLFRNGSSTRVMAADIIEAAKQAAGDDPRRIVEIREE